MSRPYSRKKIPRLRISLLLATALMSYSLFAVAQSNLGELLDAGATPMSQDEFKQQLVGKVLVGPTPVGGSIIVMYAPNGVVQGSGIYSRTSSVQAQVDGDWTIGEGGRICTSLRISGAGGVTLPPRCQRWFKYGADYFLSDSDTDRQARVFRRTVKP